MTNYNNVEAEQLAPTTSLKSYLPFNEKKLNPPKNFAKIFLIIHSIYVFYKKNICV